VKQRRGLPESVSRRPRTRRRRTCEMPLTSGRSRPTDGWRRWRSSRRTWRRSEAKQDAETKTQGAREALGGNGDGVFARASARERKEENGWAQSECGAPRRPCQRRRPDERGHRQRTGAIWPIGVALDIHDGELGSDSGDAITD